MTEALAYPPKEAAAVCGVAYTRLRQAIADGEIEVTYPSPKRQVITRQELARWLDSLPRAKSA